jgi:hypothetical protein
MSNKINKDVAKLFFIIRKENINAQMYNRLYNLLLWFSTECSDEMSWSRNKHYGQRYWSKKALELFIRNKGKTRNVGLVHEHAVPKSVLIEEINNCKTELEKEKLLNSFCKAVIVTKDEDCKLNKKFKSKMPFKEWKKKQFLFSRYTESGIQILDLKISKTTDIAAELKYLKKNDINKYKPVNTI